MVAIIVVIGVVVTATSTTHHMENCPKFSCIEYSLYAKKKIIIMNGTKYDTTDDVLCSNGLQSVQVARISYKYCLICSFSMFHPVYLCKQYAMLFVLPFVLFFLQFELCANKFSSAKAINMLVGVCVFVYVCVCALFLFYQLNNNSYNLIPNNNKWLFFQSNPKNARIEN